VTIGATEESNNGGALWKAQSAAPCLEEEDRAVSYPCQALQEGTFTRSSSKASSVQFPHLSVDSTAVPSTHLSSLQQPSRELASRNPSVTHDRPTPRGRPRLPTLTKAGFVRGTSSMSASRSPTRDHNGSFTPGRVALDLGEHLGPHYEFTSKGLRLVGGSKSRTRGQLQELGKFMVKSMKDSFPREVWDACDVYHPDENLVAAKPPTDNVDKATFAAHKLRGMSKGFSRGLSSFFPADDPPGPEISFKQELREREEDVHGELTLGWLAKQTGRTVLDIELMRDIWAQYQEEGLIFMGGARWKAFLKKARPDLDDGMTNAIVREIRSLRRRVAVSKGLASMHKEDRQEEERKIKLKFVRFPDFYQALMRLRQREERRLPMQYRPRRVANTAKLATDVLHFAELLSRPRRRRRSKQDPAEAANRWSGRRAETLAGLEEATVFRLLEPDAYLLGFGVRTMSQRLTTAEEGEEGEEDDESGDESEESETSDASRGEANAAAGGLRRARPQALDLGSADAWEDPAADLKMSPTARESLMVQEEEVHEEELDYAWDYESGLSSCESDDESAEDAEPPSPSD